MSQLGEFGLPADWTPERGLEAAQAEALRKMLLAVIGDVRLVVVRLARTTAKHALRQERRARRGSASSRSKPAKSMRRSPIASGFGSSNGNWKTWHFDISNRSSTSILPPR